MYRILLIMLAFLTAYASSATKYTVDDVPNVHVADRTRYVSNPDGILSPQAVAALDSRLADLWDKSSVEAVVVVVDNIDTDENTFATELFQHWGIGKSDNDNGVLILVVKDLRRAVIRTGYGIEGALPDISAGRIIRNEMAPHFASGDYDSGVIAAVDKIRGVVTDPAVADELRSANPNDRRQGNKESLGSVFGGYLVFVGVMTLLMAIVLVMKVQSVRTLGRNEKYAKLAPLAPVYKGLCFVGLGVPLAAYLPLRIMLNRWRNSPRVCSNCQHHMYKVDEEHDNDYLNPAQDLEEKLNSVDYDVWLCSNCGETDIFPFIQPNSGWVQCEKCGAHTARLERNRIIQQPTTRTEGTGVHEYVCYNCRHIGRKPYKIQKLADPAAAAIAAGALGAMAGRRGGGGFGSGGFGGGSFGGGSTGGGSTGGGW